jgi:Tetratricopeptide repeat
VALARLSLGAVSEYRGDPVAALAHYNACLDITRQHGVAGHEGVVLMNLGSAYGTLGRWGDALAALEQSLNVRRECGDYYGVASTLGDLAIPHCHRGDLVAALRCADEALRCFREIGYQVREHEVRLTRAEIFLRCGRHADALADVDAAWSGARAVGNRYIEALALHQRSKITSSMGNTATAAELRAESEAVLAPLHARRVRLLEALILRDSYSR